jgi:hypothetical protein
VDVKTDEEIIRQLCGTFGPGDEVPHLVDWEVVSKAIRLAREDSAEVPLNWALSPKNCEDAERWLKAGGIGNVVAGIGNAIAAAILGRGRT